MLERIARLTWRRSRLVLTAIAAGTLAAAVLGHGVEHHLKAAGFTDSASESERATALLRNTLGYDANPGLVVLVRALDHGRLDLHAPAVRNEVARLSHRLAGTRFVGKVVDPLTDRRAAGLIARDGRSVVIAGYLATQDVESDGGKAAKDAKKRVRSRLLDVSMGGFAPSFQEVNDQTRRDLTKAEIIAFPILALLLLIVFRGVIAALVPLLIGVTSILGTLLMLRVMSGFVDTSLFALNISTGLSLGLAVDYALLLVSRYREELDHHGPTFEAIRRTVQTAGRTVVFSGLTVAAAMAALIALPQRFLYSVGAAGAAVAILSSLIAVLLVPALLAVLGERINKFAIRRGPAVSAESGGWYRFARGVLRRPVLVAVASTLLLLAAASPLRNTVLTGPSAQAVPPNQPSYAANTAIDASYPRDVTQAITVAVRGSTGDAGLAELERQIVEIPGISRGSPFQRAGPDVAFANFAPAELALSSRAQDAVRAIRALHPPGAAKLLVSGNTARFIDQKRSLADHVPLVVGIIASTTLLLLFLLTGSVVLPLKTLVMNGLTLAATLGIVELSFQEGALKGPLDYTGPAAVEVTSLVFLFAVTFGLATDYAVLVMSRIKEQHDAGVANDEAVATGIGRTGRVITAAALCIAVVFLAFGVSRVFFMKQIAIGQAFGVLIDATVVRALLVPSLMGLFGSWNWWAPKPLRRLHERFGFSEA